jgi:hypothetical protein
LNCKEYAILYGNNFIEEIKSSEVEGSELSRVG